MNDPSGLYTCQGSKVSCNDIKTYYRTLEQAGQNAKAGSKERNDINRALKALGKPGERNGVTVTIVNSKHWTMNTERVNGKEVITVALGADKNLLAGKNANVTDEMAGLMGHEGTHVADYQAGVPVKGLASVTGYERRGVMTQAEVARELGYDTEYNTWSTSGGYSRNAINLEVNAAVADDCRMDALECQ